MARTTSALRVPLAALAAGALAVWAATAWLAPGHEFLAAALVVACGAVLVACGRERALRGERAAHDASRAELATLRDRAMAADRAKATFLSTMSHEIRTPMNSVVGMTELVLGTDLTPDQRECLGIVRSSADAMLALLDDVLDFARAEGREITLRPEPVRLRDIVETTVKTLAPRAEAKGLETVLDTPVDALDAVVADTARVRQVVTHLVGNAITFTEKGRIVVRLRVTQGAGTASVLLSVSDTGPGIPQAERARIFEPFEQLDGSSTRRAGGAGLGLALTARVVAAMGGTISVDSVEGEGSTFDVRFDLPPAPDEAAVVAPSALGRRALLLAPGEVTAPLLARSLRAFGLDVRIEAEAAAAAAAYRDAVRAGAPMDLLVIDGASLPSDRAKTADDLVESAIADASGVVWLAAANDLSRVAAPGPVVCIPRPAGVRDLAAAVERALGGPGVETEESPDLRAVFTAAARPLDVLVAEDHPVNRRLAVRVLERLGHRVVTVADGARAVAATADRGFDVVLMDVQMPGMDGLAATRAIRAREAGTGHRLPIVALTAHAMAGDRAACLSAGMDAYLPKPLRAADLAALLDRIAALSAQPV